MSGSTSKGKKYHNTQTDIPLNMDKIPGKNVLIGIGFFLTAVVLYSILLWLSISFDATRSFEDAKQEYLRGYPSLLRNARLLTLFHILLNCGAIVCFFKVQDNFGKLAKLIRSMIILNIVMLIWQLFSLL